ncbi:ankyrin repeat domain-containing protein [Parendozoicomonas haliclonae]|uniref:Ankyrin repeats (3 copies) n=1 Tax=Parendozoicomonas haliclonae TaxID=1960125 RepID=A0A1X7AMK5_9GAMM|nr:ankyrin repeat domain-containing protein [Parendozoicomonas haliclonae]SMA49511.1 Ankyrin repeats (3 copies) [Parendozoicomonas haliclonae]
MPQRITLPAITQLTLFLLLLPTQVTAQLMSYSELDQLLARRPNEQEVIQKIEKQRSEESKSYTYLHWLNGDYGTVDQTCSANPLSIAADHNCFQLVQHFLKTRGAGYFNRLYPNTTPPYKILNKHGLSLLGSAIQHNNMEAVIYLLSEAFPPDYTGKNTPIATVMALEFQHYAIANYLMYRGSNLPETLSQNVPADIAVNVVIARIDHGLHVNGPLLSTALHQAVNNRRLNPLIRLLNTQKVSTADLASQLNTTRELLRTQKQAGNQVDSSVQQVESVLATHLKMQPMHSLPVSDLNVKM